MELPILITGASAGYAWRFFRAGGFDQVRLDSGADLAHLEELDPKLWVALACPTTGLEFDKQTLALVDTDKDGRIRVPELLAAVKWTVARLKNADDLVKESATLPLSAIQDATPEGKAILESARAILGNLGKGTSSELSVADLESTEKIFANTKLNGDGVVIVESAETPALQAVVSDILAVFGGVTDRSGKPGVNQAKADQFFAAIKAHAAWLGRLEAEPAILPFGSATAATYAAFSAVRGKIDDFFARCRLAAFDPRALAALNRDEKDYAALGAKNISAAASEAADFPLSKVAAGASLPLGSGVNPAWADRLAVFAAATGAGGELDETGWRALSAKFGPYEAWLGAKAGAEVEKLGADKVRAYAAGTQQADINALIAKDKAEEAKANAIAEVDKLVRFHRDLHLLLTNFVNFKDLYDGGSPAIFQIGTLYLDQRSCTLCLAVEDGGRHAAMAGLSGAYLAYCDCVRKATGEKIQIVAAFTDGDSDNLMVGRNGVFYDRKGRDFDATIVKIVENPISLRQAFYAPYKKLARFIEDQIQKRAAAADAASGDQMTKLAQGVGAADPAAAKTPPKLDVGVIAAIGVAFGSIGTFLGTVFTKFVDLSFIQCVGVIIGVILAISGPSVLLAYMKLRKRNLGPLLDANGWAVNTRARINVPFGETLTGVAKLPPGAKLELFDPFAEKEVPWRRYLRIAAAVAVLFLAFKYRRGDFDASLSPGLKSTKVLGSFSPNAGLPDAGGSSTNAPAK
jgi:hypothetical protein